MTPYAGRSHESGPTLAESLALAYLGIPTVIFLAGWLVFPLGPIAAALIAVSILAVTVPRARGAPGLGVMMLPLVCVAALWTVLGGVGHFVYANTDWVVRDAVLVDLVRDSWPVNYRVEDGNLILRAPIGYFLPAALIGKLWGIAAAEQALLVWTITGVVLTFALMLRDRPALKPALVRIAIFIAFSGMDIVGTYAHYRPFEVGEHLEWWAFLYQYSSLTTQLFWVPNHALPGWLAVAWLLGQDRRELSTATAIQFVLFAPLWSPLTALGIAPIVAAALARKASAVGVAASLRAIADPRALVPLAVCCALVFPYIVAGSETVAAGSNNDLRWVNEQLLPRYIEFVLIEFAGFALILLRLSPRDPLLWAAVGTLLVLPIYRLGPSNDLAMRASIPALAMLAIGIGRWLSTRAAFARTPRMATVATALLLIGAVTPFMEFARAFKKPAWPLDERASVVDVTRGTHYLTSPDRPWLKRFLKRPD